MWKLFYGDGINRTSDPTARTLSPELAHRSIACRPTEEDLFLHVLEIGDRGTTGKRHTELLDGVNFLGAAFEQGPMALFSATGSVVSTGEVSLPDLGCEALIITGLHPDSVYELNLGGLNVSSASAAVLPGVSAGTLRVRSNAMGVVRVERQGLGNLRLRIARV